MKKYLNIIIAMLEKVEIRELLKFKEIKVKTKEFKVKIKEFNVKKIKFHVKEYFVKVKNIKIKFNVIEYLVKVKNHVTIKHVYVTAIVFFQLLAIFCLFVNIYYVLTFIALYTIFTIALFIYLYQEEVKQTRNTASRFNKTETM